MTLVARKRIKHVTEGTAKTINAIAQIGRAHV